MVAPFGLSLSYEALCDIPRKASAVYTCFYGCGLGDFCISAPKCAKIGRFNEVNLMSADEQLDCTRTDPDSSANGQCSFCAAPNPRTNIACNFCGSRLPWTFEVAGRNSLERKLFLARLQKSETVEPVTDPAPELSPPTPLTLNTPLLIQCDIIDTRIIRA